VPPWIFINDTDKVKGGLMVLFFGLAFFVDFPLEIFLPTPLETVSLPLYNITVLCFKYVKHNDVALAL